MADNQEIVAPPAGGDDQPVEVPKRNQKPEIPPVTFREFNVSFSPSYTWKMQLKFFRQIFSACKRF